MSDDKTPQGGGTPNLPPSQAPTIAGEQNNSVAPGNPAAKASSSWAIPPGAVKAEPMTVPPIPLHPSAAPKPSKSAPVPAKKDQEPKDTFRELIETIVFVVVLVLMLKTFLAEAFVIPTGSMAPTLLGYHYKITCKQCGYPDLVNASSQADPQGGREADPVVSCQCENCGYTNIINQAR